MTWPKKPAWRGLKNPTKNNGDVERWVEVDSDPFMALHASNKDGALTIAGIDNAELPNVQLVETKEGTMTLPVDDPDGKGSGGELAVEDSSYVQKCLR